LQLGLGEAQTLDDRRVGQGIAVPHGRVHRLDIFQEIQRLPMRPDQGSEEAEQVWGDGITEGFNQLRYRPASHSTGGLQQPDCVVVGIIALGQVHPGGEPRFGEQAIPELSPKFLLEESLEKEQDTSEH